MLVVLAGAGVIALTAQLRVEMWDVPHTAQTLGVLVIGATFGFRRGTAAAAVYLCIGALGLPIFAGPHAGLSAITGRTGGYLMGFVLSAGTICLLADHGFLRSYRKTALAMVIATVPVFVLGVAWLMHFRPAHIAWHYGFVIFIPGAIAKIALATAITGRSDRRRV